MEKEIYLARGKCTNCGHRNYPYWGTYKKGVDITTYPCPNCGCKTWVLDKNVEDSDVGKTNETINPKADT